MAESAVGGAGAHIMASNIFTFMGHSCSTGIQHDVPPGCMLVTLAECGDYTYSNLGSPFRNFLEIFENQMLLANPIANKEAIEKLLGAKININYPDAPNIENKRYMDTLFSAQLYHRHEENIFIPNIGFSLEKKYDIYPSGLYRSGGIKLKPVYKNAVNIHENIMDDLEYMYQSQILYPRKKSAIDEGKRLIKEVGKNFRVFENIGIKFKILQSKIFEMFPGIHYLITCRSPCSEDYAERFRVALRRSESRERSNIYNYLHNPHLAQPMYIAGKVHYGEIGQKYRLPAGVKHTNYIYYGGRGPQLIETNANGREIIEIVPRGGSRQTKKRRSKGKRKYTHKHNHRK